MDKKIIIIILLIFSLNWGCKKDDSEFLTRLPSQVLTTEQAFADKAQVYSILANLYSRMYDQSQFSNWSSFADFNVAFWSEAGRYEHFQDAGWGYDSWRIWDYVFIREINLFIERCSVSTKLDEADKNQFLAEARFLRASYYFELVKVIGGVPLILKTETYNFSGDPTYLRHPRAKESEIYDFIISEAEAIKSLLPANADNKSRATTGAALAMECRAALYAGSIAKYGATTPTVSLPGGEVGIPVSLSTGYYTIALRAAQEIISGSAGAYALYKKKSDLSENFAALFYDKSNPEAIFVKDYKLKGGWDVVHYFTVANQPRYGADEEEGGRINPALNLVQEFELLSDNSYKAIPVKDNTGKYIAYTNQTDIFAGRDARLSGTVMLPGTQFKSKPVDIMAGVMLADSTIVAGDSRGQQKTLPGTTIARQVVGQDGPIDGYEFIAQSGFYLRKYLDPAPLSGSRGAQSEVWFMRYRYGEVLLNAAEAAFELGQLDDAAGYMNQVRERAGFTVPLTAADMSFDRIVHERTVELSFEGLNFMDLKRWRIAGKVFDGVTMTNNDLLTNIGKADKRRTQVYGLWPYKIFAPGTANDGKWIYKIMKSARVTGSDLWQLGNYYSRIDPAVVSNNPLIVNNPNH